MKIIVSSKCLAEPKLKSPRTSDMSDIVDAFRRNGLIRPVPSAFQTHEGTMIIHPVIYNEMRKQLARSENRAVDNWWH